jgi:archaellum component FlaC
MSGRRQASYPSHPQAEIDRLSGQSDRQHRTSWGRRLPRRIKPARTTYACRDLGRKKIEKSISKVEDLEARRKRAAEFEARRQQHKPKEPKAELGAIDEVLNVLEEAAEDFDASFGKINQPLIDAKIEVERLRGELAEAEARLNAIEARGDSVQRLTNAVRLAESQLQNLVSKAEAEEVSRLAEKHYGWPIGHSKISPEMKREFALHASVLVFKTFYVPRSIVLPGQIPSVDALQAQLQRVGESLVALRDHLSQADA